MPILGMAITQLRLHHQLLLGGLPLRMVRMVALLHPEGLLQTHPVRVAVVAVVLAVCGEGYFGAAVSCWRVQPRQRVLDCCWVKLQEMASGDSRQQR